MQYAAAAAGDYIEFSANYDQWLESNFSDMTHNATEVINADPALAVASRESQGLIPGWQADLQTNTYSEDNLSSMHGRTIRNFISGSAITISGSMIRFKFKASSAGPLTIQSAYFGACAAGSYNFSGSPTTLYFNNGTVIEGGSDAVGAVGSSGPTTITIPAGEYAWTNWFAYPVTAGAGNYLISFAVSSTAGEGYVTYWNPGSGIQSYYENGSTATGTWDPSDDGFSSGGDPSIHAVSEMATWQDSGTATSQVYDTKLAAPAYSQISWTTNGSGTYSVNVRSSDNADMSGATSWVALPSSPASLAGVSHKRYLQFQAVLTAASPYTTYPQMDDVKITWPGQTALVELSGYFTKRPNYGTFKVLVDGDEMVKALNISLSATKSFQGKNFNFSLSSDVKSKNTGK